MCHGCTIPRRKSSSCVPKHYSFQQVYANSVIERTLLGGLPILCWWMKLGGS